MRSPKKGAHFRENARHLSASAGQNRRKLPGTASGEEVRFRERVAHSQAHSARDKRRIEREEANLRIRRVQPFELFVRTNRQGVCLPLFQDDYTAPLYQGQSFAAAKKLVRENCLNRLRQADHTVKERDLLKIIDPWALAKYKGPTKYVDELTMKPATGAQSKSSSKAWREMLDSIKPRLPTERLQTPDISAPQWLIEDLTAQIVQETGLGRRLSRYIVEEVILRNISCPRMETLAPGEMPLLSKDVGAHFSNERTTA